MLASIHPLGERARGNRWAVTATAFFAASLAAGGALGAALGAGGGAASLPTRVAGVILVGGIALALAADGLHARLPSARRQVDEDWLHEYRGWVYGAGFGFQLGLGVVTIVTTATVHLTLLLALLSGSPGRGALVGAAFGLARALPLLAVAGVHDATSLRQLHRRLATAAPRAERASVLALAGFAAAAVAALAP